MRVTEAIAKLLAFSQANGLVAPQDVVFAQNALLAALRLDTPGEESARQEALPQTATPMLEALCEEAVRQKLIKDLPFYREQFSAHLMNLLTPPPSWIAERFASIREREGIVAATDWFYALCRVCDYIRVDQIARNVAFAADSYYGRLEITINLSKPEKDPREIALLKNIKAVGYPLCMLCIENEGFAGHPGYPSHETLRTIPLTLGQEEWRFQYSPYSYYPEHCIALNTRHIPMEISRRTFVKLLDFVDQFPHYFMGSNADLPIVGGSILNHDHFQGGRHVFPMDKAPAYASFVHAEFPSVRIEAVRWPMTCIRLSGEDKEPLIALADRLLTHWSTYDDPGQQVLHETDGTPHNTVTPIARRMEKGYVLQMVLRNNRATHEHPLGIFHPHAELHHIKKENIGLIEVMGLFILPGRLLSEMEGLSGYLTGEKAMEKPAKGDPLAKHYEWVLALSESYGASLTQEEADRVLREALAKKCVQVLEDAGVFKATPEGDAALGRFLASLAIMPA